METIIKKTNIAVIVPCYNEEDGIMNVIRALPVESAARRGCSLDIIVVDNNSTDQTAAVARAAGATVLEEKRQGKGYAVRSAFDYISRHTEYDYAVMLDGDGSYDLSEMFRLVDPLMEGFGSVIIGSRIQGRIHKGSITRFNLLGNWVFSHLVRYAFHIKVTDTLTGYFAWKRESIERLGPHLLSKGFAIEMEMITKMARLGEEMYSVPISYHKREGETKLRPIRDGFRILSMFFKNLFWEPKDRAIKKIAFISDAVMPYHNGGKERRLYEISRRLVSDTREVHIYTMKWWDGPRTVVHDGVYFHAIGKLRPLYVGERRSITEGIFFACAVFRLFFERFDVMDVDQIPFFPLFSARIVAWVKRVPMYATWHEVWGKEYWHKYLGGLGGIIGYTIERLSFMVPDVVISNSEHTTRRLRESGCVKTIITVPLGVDVEGIAEAESDVAHSDVIFVGRLLDNKHVDLLIKAVDILKKQDIFLSALIIGDGPERQALETLVMTRGLEKDILFKGPVDDKEKYAYMKSSKMFVFPSTREGFGISVIEANAAGLPVITTSHEQNAAKDLIVEGVNGFVTDADEGHIAEKIAQVLEMRDMMNPQDNISRHDWSVVLENIEYVTA
ncbi:MAG: glycosyltransferase [Candidatus Yonathbacteria bacterium]|nr:glycosyltransferase [Candidatus Yonathbacteria bacterium]